MSDRDLPEAAPVTGWCTGCGAEPGVACASTCPGELDTEHGIDTAAYQRTAAGSLPTIICSCGFIAQAGTWEETGAALDDHLFDDDPEAA